jgi:hypothetical protein
MMKKASGGDSPLRQGADGGGLRYVSWKLIWFLGFPRQGEYIGGRTASGGGPGGHTT